MTLKVPYYGEPFGTALASDTRGFGANAWTTVQNPDFGPVKTKYAAFGKSIHGVHYGNYVVNTLDFAQPHTYNVAGRFNTAIRLPLDPEPTPEDFVWNGSERVQRRHFAMVDSIADGYLSGSVNVFQLPGVPTRVPNADDVANYRAWKNYTVSSTQQAFVYGARLGKNHGLFCAAPGNCFNVGLAGSVGSREQSRKFRWTVQRIGQFGVHADPYDIEWDTGVVDGAGSANANAVITNNLVGNAIVAYDFSVLDWNSTGSKCLVGVAIRPEDGITDDGTNQLRTWPFAVVEFTFSLGADNRVGVTGRVVVKYMANDTPMEQGNSYVEGPNVQVRPGKLRKYDGLDGTVDIVYVVSFLIDKQVYSGPEPDDKNTVIFEGTIENRTEVWPGGVPPSVGTDPGAALALARIDQGLGQSRFVGGGSSYESKIMRVIHMCYDKTDTIVPVTLSYVSVNEAMTLTTTAIVSGGGGSHTRTLLAGASFFPPSNYAPNNRSVATGTGEAVLGYTTQRESYSRKCIELRVAGEVVDYVQVESTSPISAQRLEIKTGYAPGSDSTLSATKLSDIETSYEASPGENSMSPSEGALTGPFAWVGTYDPLKQAGAADGFIRNQGIGDLTAPRARLKAFVRLESNRLVSFNLGDHGNSINTVDTQASFDFKYSVQLLGPGTHIRRTVFDIHNNRVALNNVSGFGQSNPSRGRPATECNCTLHPATGQSIVDSTYQITFVGSV